MKHLEEEQIWALIDGTLNDVDLIMYEAHLQNCDECKAYFEDMKAFDASLSQTVVEAPSLRFSKNVMELIEEDMSLTFKPLVSGIWRKIFATSLGSSILALIFLGNMSASSSGKLPSVLQNLAVSGQQVNQFVAFAQNPIFLISALGLLAFWSLFAVDKFILSKRLR